MSKYVLEEVRATLVFEFFDQFFDVTGDAITASNQECVGSIDDDEVLDSDGGDETVITMHKNIFTIEANMSAMNDGMITRLG